MLRMKWTDLSLNSLQYFIDTIELNSFSKAAVKNNVSRPAISQAIRRLEENLGQKLINHNKNKIELTEDGHNLFPVVKKSLSCFIHTFESVNSKTKFPISIATSATIAEYFLLPALKKMNITDQGLIKIKIGTSFKVQRLVEEGKAQIGILISDKKIFDFDSISLKKGKFSFLSKTGKLSSPIVTTEPRQEVTELINTLKRKNKFKDLSHVEVESWSLCNKANQTLGGSYLIPDFIADKKSRKVANINLKQDYEVITIFKNKNQLNPLERKLIKLLKS